MTWLLSPYRDSQTYRSALYMLAGLALGVFEFTVIVAGLSLGAGLLITLLGIPVLVVTLVFARALAAMERNFARTWLGAPMPRRFASRRMEQGSLWSRFKDLVASKRTWREVAFLLLRLPMGILDFTFIVVLVGLMLSGFAVPILYLAGVDMSTGGIVVDTFPKSWLYIPISVLFLLVGGRLVEAWSRVSGAFASFFLGRLEQADLKLEVADILSRNTGADAHSILEALEMRLGEGPFLTATKVEAALIALESTGHVEVANAGAWTTYALVGSGEG